MGFSVIFIAISCFAVLQAAAIGDLKGESRHSTVQITRSTIRDNSALKKTQENLRAAHMSLQSNQIVGSATHDQVQIQPKHHSQEIQTSTLSDQGSGQSQLSQSTTRDSFLTTTTSSAASGNIHMNGELSHQNQQRQEQGNSDIRERFNAYGQSMNQQRFYDSNQQNSEEKQFYNSREQSPALQQQHFSRRQQSQQPSYSDRPSSLSEQQFYNMRQQDQQQQFNDPRNQQEELFNSRQQSNSQQQQLFNAGQQSFEKPQEFSNAGQQSNSQQQQLFNPGQQSFEQPQEFSNAGQQSNSQQQQLFNAGQQSFEQPQEFSNAGQQSNVQQQLFNAGQQSFEQHQKFNNAGQQSLEQQQQLFNAGQQQRMYNNMQTIDGQNMNNQFQGLSIHQSQIRSERPLILSQNILTQMHSKGVRKDVQLSAYDNREHGLVLPRGTSVQSSSVVVSGLKNLPVLPAMVYNAGPVPATHAIAYGRDGFYKGSAHLNQQMRTPYVRYVYSHIL